MPVCLIIVDVLITSLKLCVMSLHHAVNIFFFIMCKLNTMHYLEVERLCDPLQAFIQLFYDNIHSFFSLYYPFYIY